MSTARWDRAHPRDAEAHRPEQEPALGSASPSLSTRSRSCGCRSGWGTTESASEARRPHEVANDKNAGHHRSGHRDKKHRVRGAWTGTLTNLDGLTVGVVGRLGAFHYLRS